MPKLFELNRISEMKIKNRFVRSATYEAFADLDGRVNDRLKKYMETLAIGGVGMIITSHAYVAKEGQAGPGQLGIYDDEMIEGLSQLTKTIHKNGSVVVAQLAHAGKRGIGKGTFSPIGPSDLIEEGKKKITAMTEKQIQNTIQAFGDAARRAVRSGFDGVQIHAAHSYLLSQFLSPYYNLRTDKFGGTIENRSRFLVQVYEEVRKQVGDSFPVMVKINSEDFLEGGLTVEEMILTCRLLEERGIDAVELSGGTMDSGRFFFSRPGTAKSPELEVYYRDAARKFKEHIKIPLILVGGFLSYDIACETIESGVADMVAFSRPLIREPGLINRWEKGDRQKATCISCNKCFATLFKKGGLNCAAEKKE